MVVAAIGVAAISADARSQLRKYRNQPVMAPMTNHSGIERATKHDPCSQLMLASRSIEGHSREHRKGRGDDNAHAARDGEHDKDDAVVELGHEGTLKRCRAWRAASTRRRGVSRLLKNSF